LFIALFAKFNPGTLSMPAG